MKRIFCKRPLKCYAPEVDALSKYFNGRDNVEFYVFDDKDYVQESEYDFEYVMMGFDSLLKKRKLPVVHDYASLSTGKFVKIKDVIKKNFQHEPVLRSFLNVAVERSMSFCDEIPSIIRDMGVDDSFFVPLSNTKKIYDIVYCGAISKSRDISSILKIISATGLDIILVGEPDICIYNEYNKYKNITFTGRLGRKFLPEIYASCHYGLNYTPDVYPFNIQTSTKLLEYCASGLKIVTNNYRWAKKFELYNGGRFYFFDGVRDFDEMKLRTYEYHTPNVENHSWDNIILNSGLPCLLEKL